MRWIIALAATAGVWVALPTTASASTQGYNEPAYTKTAANNAFFWHWQAIDGTDEAGNKNYTYYLCFHTYRDNVTVESSNGTTGGPGSSNCTTSLRSGPTPSSGDYGATPFAANTVLDDGHTYQMCASGYYRWPYLPWKLDAANQGSCPATTIDRNKPNIGVSVNGTADYTNNPVLQLRIDYQDATSPPWQGVGGVASTWVCVARNAQCSPGGAPVEACSRAANPSALTTFFTCTYDVTAEQDGDWNACAKTADTAVPDNPSGTNQFANATSNNANISSVLCGHVVLDRVAPAVTAQASRTTVNVGELVTFGASATDASSGATGTYDWDFGDNTQHGTGAAPTHTYTQAGTFTARASTKDRAGNDGSGTVTITVVAPGGGGSGTTPSSGTGTTPSGGTGTTTSGGGTTPPPSGGATSSPPATTSGAGVVTSPSSAATVSQQAGGGGTQRARVGGLSVVAPRKLTLSKARTKIPFVFTVDTAGTVEVSLLRGASIAAKGTARISRAGSLGFSLKLPKKPKAGRHTIKVVFRPRSGAAATRTLRITFVRPAKPHALLGIPLAR